MPQSLFAAYTFAQISVIVGKLFGFALQGAEEEMLKVSREGLRAARARPSGSASHNSPDADVQ